MEASEVLEALAGLDLTAILRGMDQVEAVEAMEEATVMEEVTATEEEADKVPLEALEV